MGLYPPVGPVAVVAPLEHKNLVLGTGGSQLIVSVGHPVLCGSGHLNTECGMHVAESYRSLARFLLGDCKPNIGHSFARKLPSDYALKKTARSTCKQHGVDTSQLITNGLEILRTLGTG
jgi:hypothetical protein